jgi:hypothetical protein
MNQAFELAQLVVSKHHLITFLSLGVRLDPFVLIFQLSIRAFRLFNATKPVRLFLMVSPKLGTRPKHQKQGGRGYKQKKSVAKWT